MSRKILIIKGVEKLPDEKEERVDHEKGKGDAVGTTS